MKSYRLYLKDSIQKTMQITAESYSITNKLNDITLNNDILVFEPSKTLYNFNNIICILEEPDFETNSPKIY